MGMRASVKFTIGMVVSVIICCGLFVFFRHITPKRVPNNKIPLQTVQFKTNGHITKKFLIKALAIKKNALFDDINIFNLKKRLLNITQVKDVYIERKFPASIFIKLEERIPLLKFVIQNGDEIDLLFVDRNNGSIFHGSCLPKKVMLATPYVELNLERTPTNKIGYKPIAGIQHIKHLIDLLRDEYPYIYNDIHKFSLLKYDPREGANWSRIEIYQKSGKVIVFNPHNLELQLLNLDYILNERKFPQNSVRKIDLSNFESAIIETK